MKEIKKRELTQDKICLAALEIIDKEGLEALSMRHLATHLRVEAASLYNHIKNKSELLDLIQEHTYKKLPKPKKQMNWKKYLHEFAHSIRNGLLETPNLVPLFATRPSVSISALEQTEKAFQVLRTAGFKYTDMIFAYQSLCIFVLGHLQAEVGYVPGAKKETDFSFPEMLDNQKFPHLVKAFSKSNSAHYNQWFNFGINAIITGLDIILKNSKRTTK